jgi:hypothetical protein
MKSTFVTYFSFLLRIWRESDSATWRASLEDPHTHKQQGFSDLEKLIAFLIDLTESSMEDPETKNMQRRE